MTNLVQTKIDAVVQKYLAGQQVPGAAVGLFREKATLYKKGFGFANLEHKAPVTPDTVFSIASVTKLFTGTAVLQLCEQGKLNLTDTLSRHLQDLPEAWQSIQIHHILTHQSGIKSYTEVPDYWETTRLDISREEILGLVADLPLQFTPGQRQAYDNTGYYLLGFLIESLSGQSYGAFLQEHIFSPLQMGRTQVNDPYAVVPDRAAGYTVENGAICHAPYYSPSGTFSGGVLISTLNDLARFAASLYDDRLLSQASRQMMWTPYLSHEKNELANHFSLGYSWFLVEPPGKRPFAGHNGGMVGYASSFVHFREEKVTAIALYNSDTVTEPHALCQEIAEIYFNSLVEHH